MMRGKRKGVRLRDQKEGEEGEEGEGEEEEGKNRLSCTVTQEVSPDFEVHMRELFPVRIVTTGLLHPRILRRD